MLIVKKMPILQGFPDFETVKNLSGKIDGFELRLVTVIDSEKDERKDGDNNLEKRIIRLESNRWKRFLYLY